VASLAPTAERRSRLRFHGAATSCARVHQHPDRPHPRASAAPVGPSARGARTAVVLEVPRPAPRPHFRFDRGTLPRRPGVSPWSSLLALLGRGSPDATAVRADAPADPGAARAEADTWRMPRSTSWRRHSAWRWTCLRNVRTRRLAPPNAGRRCDDHDARPWSTTPLDPMAPCWC